MNDIEKLILDLVSADKNDDEVFCMLTNKFMQLLEVDVYFVAETIGVSTPTFKRWILGKSSPHPTIRKIVYLTLMKLAQEKLATLKVDEVVVIGC